MKTLGASKVNKAAFFIKAFSLRKRGFAVLWMEILAFCTKSTPLFFVGTEAHEFLAAFWMVVRACDTIMGCSTTNAMHTFADFKVITNFLMLIFQYT